MSDKPNWEGKYNYNFPTSIRFGKGVIEELADHLVNEGIKNPLIVTDPFLKDMEFFKKIMKGLEAKSLHPHIFSKIDKNPIKRNVLDGAKSFHDGKCDAVVGIGGGASLDVARAVTLMTYHKKDLFEYEDSIGGDKYVTEKIPYFVTVPTTSGTGSEVGRSAVISDDVTHKKMIIFSPRLMARKVFADPELTLNLPASVTAATGLDALTHNMEAYVARGVSPMCDGIALEAIKLIGESLETATLNPNLEARAKMMMGSLMGAVAFQKGLGIVHSLAHPLSTKYDFHHGLANAIMLPHGVNFNKEVAAQKYKNIAAALNVANPSVDTLITYLNKLNEKLGIKKELSSYGVKAEGLNDLSQLAIEDVCHPSNPRTVTKNDFFEIYKKAL